MVRASYEAKLQRGAFINALGLVGKLLYPLLFLAITWLGTPETAGLYLLCVAMAEMGASAVQAGFTDAIVVYGSRHVERADAGDVSERDRLYAVLASGFAIPVILGVSVAFVLQGWAQEIVDLVYPGRPQLSVGLMLVGWTLPLVGISQAAIAATKARMRMEEDVLFNSFLRPLLLLLLSLLCWWIYPGLASLLWALLLSYGVLAIFALRSFFRFYSLEPFVTALRKHAFTREVLHFGLPQSLYLTLEKYLARMDLMILGALGVSNFELGLYGTAAMITVNIREIRLVFSGALGPVVARYHADGDRNAFAALLSRVTRWTTTIAAPVVLMIAATRNELLSAFDEGYGQADTRFMLLLLIPPMLNCSFGLVGNCIVFTGHSGYNLLNSVLVAGLNTVFNLLLIPRLGLVGAAAGTALASLLVTLLQVFELRFLERVSVRMRDVYKPFAGFALCALALALPWLSHTRHEGSGMWLGVALPFLFAALMLALRHEEVVGLARRVYGAISV